MRELEIAYGRSNHTPIWTNDTISFEALTDRLRDPVRTPETVEEYRKLKGDAKQKAKDKGGFVGGILKDGKRNGANVLSRSMLTLDADKATKSFLEGFKSAFPFSAILYSTHSHTPESPRVRIVMPLSRDVSAEEYVAVSRYAAADIGLEMFDQCSFRPAQLMYWPSSPKDGEYVFIVVDDKPWLDPDDILSKHPDWRNMETLPSLPSENATKNLSGRKPEDPRAKNGIIGAFCRTYTIDEAISEFLPDIYEPSGSGRYSYTEADSKAGLVVYGGLWAYSNHATDPASMGHLLNAFDLVRIHKFGYLDSSAEPGTPPNRLPSYQAMCDFALSIPDVRKIYTEERLRVAGIDFSGDDSWKMNLSLDKKGNVMDSVENLTLILRNDQRIAGIVHNTFTDQIMAIAPLPWEQLKPGWSDTDAASLKCYISAEYGIYAPAKLKDAFLTVTGERPYHPVKEYLESLPSWDGEIRAERLFIDYLGAEDTPYVRAVTRKLLAAAIARIYEPGIKFDSVLILSGPQGIGKSTIFSRLGGKWFSDSLQLTDMKDKTGAEKLQGYWILELGELAGIKKAEVETVKSFISRTDDKFRPAYAQNVESHQRQCVIVGSTNNEDGFLRDITGNRRFWPVAVTGESELKPWDLDDATVSMIWAEAILIYRSGEILYLRGEEAAAAEIAQDSSIEKDEREGLVKAYLDTLLPENWEDLTLEQRRDCIRGEGFLQDREGKVLRTHVCTMEIWSECFGNDPGRMRKQDSYDISAIMRKLGWNRFMGNKNGTMNLKLYGKQRVFVRDGACSGAVHEIVPDEIENIPF